MKGKILCYYSSHEKGHGERLSCPPNNDDKPDEHLFFDMNIDHTFLPSYISLMEILNSNYVSKKFNLDTFNMTSHDNGHDAMRTWLENHDILDDIIWNGQAIHKLERKLTPKMKKLKKKHDKKRNHDLSTSSISCHDGDMTDNHTIKRQTTNTHVHDIRMKFLLIFDLNNVLIHRVHGKNTCYKRPYVSDFLIDLSKYYHIALWTSMKCKNAQKYVKRALPEELWDDMLFIWFQDHCRAVEKDKMSHGDDVDDDMDDDSVSIATGEHYNGEIWTKPLRSVWKDFPSYSSENTLLIDDSAEKCACNPIHTYINIQPYKPTVNIVDRCVIDDLDDCLKVDGALHRYLIELARYPGTLMQYIAENGKP